MNRPRHPFTGPGHYVLDADGDPIRCDDLLVWAEWFERTARTRDRIIGSDKDEGPGGTEILISTVFLGLDHNWSGGAPVLWETMVFGGPLDQEQDRYTSRAAALAGHQAMCQRVRSALLTR